MDNNDASKYSILNKLSFTIKNQNQFFASFQVNCPFNKIFLIIYNTGFSKILKHAFAFKYYYDRFDYYLVFSIAETS